jgi:hypothetical protein
MPEIQDCNSLRRSVLSYFDKQVEVSAVDQICVVTLPFKTLDDRYLEVFVEPKIGDFSVVHDGGNATGELYSQGMHMTPGREAQMNAIARRYGVTYSDGAFTAGCRPERLQQTVWAIAQCASMAMHEVLTHQPVIEDESVSARVHRTIDEWKPSHMDLRQNFRVKGTHTGAEHVFDAVAFPKTGGLRPVAVKTLGSSYAPQQQMGTYGHLALDVRGTEYDWPRLAIVARAERWPVQTLEIVRGLSAKTIELETGQEKSLGEILPRSIDELSSAA